MPFHVRLLARAETRSTTTARRRNGLIEVWARDGVGGHGSSGGDSRVNTQSASRSSGSNGGDTCSVALATGAQDRTDMCSGTCNSHHWYWGDVAHRIAASLFRQDDRAAMASRRYGCAKTTRVFTLWGPARDQSSSAFQSALRQRHNRQALAASLAEITQADTTASRLKAADMLAAGKTGDAQSKNRGFHSRRLFDRTSSACNRLDCLAVALYTILQAELAASAD